MFENIYMFGFVITFLINGTILSGIAIKENDINATIGAFAVTLLVSFLWPIVVPFAIIFGIVKLYLKE